MVEGLKAWVISEGVAAPKSVRLLLPVKT